MANQFGGTKAFERFYASVEWSVDDRSGAVALIKALGGDSQRWSWAVIPCAQGRVARGIVPTAIAARRACRRFAEGLPDEKK